MSAGATTGLINCPDPTRALTQSLTPGGSGGQGVGPRRWPDAASRLSHGTADGQGLRPPNCPIPSRRTEALRGQQAALGPSGDTQTGAMLAALTGRPSPGGEPQASRIHRAWVSGFRISQLNRSLGCSVSPQISPEVPDESWVTTAREEPWVLRVSPEWRQEIKGWTLSPESPRQRSPGPAGAVLSPRQPGHH